jgi:hypothetical protein
VLALSRQHARVPSGPSSSTALTAIALTAIACGTPAPEGPQIPVVPRTSAIPTAQVAASGPVLPSGHTKIAEALPGEAPFVLSAIEGGRSVLAVSEAAGDRVAWARRVDEAGAMGPIQRFADRHVLGAIERAGKPAWLTSDGAKLCVTSEGYAGDGTACVAGSPAAIVPVGDRVALLSLTSMHPPSKHAAKATRKASLKPSAKKSATKKGKSAAKKTSKATSKKHGEHAAKNKKKKGAKPPGKSKATHAHRAWRPSRPLVELFVRWIDERGSVDAEPRSTGLHFEAPLDGMTLADARSRAPGIDVLWYETAPKRRSRSALGSGRLMAGSLRADGSLDFASRVAVIDADVEYGRLKDHRAPRLVGSPAATAYLGIGAKGDCEAIRVFPKLGPLTPSKAACAVAPDSVVEREAEDASLGRILADDPQRAFGQPRGDFGRAAWAGDRAYWQHDGKLRSAARGDGSPRDERPPFPTKRSRIAWGALGTDGHGIALVDGRARLIGATGPHASVVTASAPLPRATGSSELSADRRFAVRIGASWWRARGERARVWWPGADSGSPSPQVAHRATQRASGAHPDTSVLVGGQSTGIALDLTASALAVALFAENGQPTPIAAISPAPVRPGFDACEQRDGGAIVAGVSSNDPAAVVAFTLRGGAAGPVQRVPLPIHEGELGVRLVPLPAGGAILTDLGRRHVVWLDNEARPLGSADWPPEESDAACLDGRPMRRVVPGPTPRQMVPVPDTERGSCIVGDAVWGRDGRLRWVGATMVGLDAHADVAALSLSMPDGSVLPVEVHPLPVAARTVTPARCPPDMVSIGGRFCVDRFESSIVDESTGEPLSPDYPTTPNLLDFALGEWATGRERIGDIHARAFPLPFLDPRRIGRKTEPLAVSRLGARPSGYLTGLVAESACSAAGKRLCTLDEFVMACRGEADTLFPYGETYQDGVCNVFREEHPAVILHDNASVGHLDPRLNRVFSKGKPLLQTTGASPACRSQWGDDAVYDMVGNLDEWVNEGNGAFAGGFYARSTRSGCEAVVTNHPRSYLDYSTGARCCRD